MKFIELKIKKRSFAKYNAIAENIQIELSGSIAFSSLPYSDILSEEKLAKSGYKRINKSIVVARGDGRSPQQIIEAGGFHPYGAITGQYKEPKEILDVEAHRYHSDGSGFVSCTGDMRVAKNFSFTGPTDSIQLKAQLKNVGYVYLIMVTGAVGPGHGTMFKFEKEYSVPAGIDAQQIIAHREVRDLKMRDFKGSSIFVNLDFIKRYPDPKLWKKIVSAYLMDDEELESTDLLANLIDSQIKQSDISQALYSVGGSARFFSTSVASRSNGLDQPVRYNIQSSL